MKIFFLFFSIFILGFKPAFSEALKDDLLKYSSGFKNIHDFIKSDAALNEGSVAIQAALLEQEAISNDPNARAKQFYQQEVKKEPCSHCPRYLDLVLEVNKIVEKVNTFDQKIENEKLIQLSKLNFLYFITKSTLDDGKVKCSTVNSQDPFLFDQINKGNMTLAAEEALALPNVTDVQYFATGDREVHYFYRGAGVENDTIIEVVMVQNKPSIIKYYKYQDNLNLPSLGDDSTPVARDKDNFVNINPKIERENLVLPVDIKLGSIGTKDAITDGLSLKTQTDIGYNQQKETIAITTKEGGTSFVVLEGINNTNGVKSINTIANYSFDLNSESGLKVNSSAEQKIESTVSNQPGVAKTKIMTLQLTDHDHEYFKIKNIIDPEGKNTISFGNKIKVGDNRVGADLQINPDQSRTYGINFSGEGLVETAGITYHKSNLEDSVDATVVGNYDSRTKINTVVSRSTIKRTIVSVSLERAINSTATMVVTVKGDDNLGYQLMYQYEKKF